MRVVHGEKRVKWTQQDKGSSIDFPYPTKKGYNIMKIWEINSAIFQQNVHVDRVNKDSTITRFALKVAEQEHLLFDVDSTS